MSSQLASAAEKHALQAYARSLKWVSRFETDERHGLHMRDQGMLPERMGNEKRVEELRAFADRMLAAGGKRVVITKASAIAVAVALKAYADHLSRPSVDYPLFTVDVWEGHHVLEQLAGCSNAMVARAAFDQAVNERPRCRVTLRSRTRIVAEFKGDEISR